MLVQQFNTAVRAALWILMSALLSSCLGNGTVHTSNLVSINVTPSNSIVTIGVPTSLTATGSFSDGSTKDVSSIAMWNTSNPTVAMVNSTGLVSGVNQGQALITVNAGDVKATATVNVVTSGANAGGLVSPTGVAATAGNGQITVNWISTPGTSYNLYYATNPGLVPTNAATYSTKIFNANPGRVITGLTNGVSYYVIVTAVSTSGESAASNVAVATPSSLITGGSGATPTNVMATANLNQINVSWSPVIGAISYNVYYGTNPAITTLNGTKIPTTASSTIINGLINGTTYYVIVTAVSTSGESAASTVAMATPSNTSAGFISPPTMVTATAGNGQMTVNWNAVSGATSYNIYYGTNPAISTTNGTKVVATASGKIVTGLTNSTIYYVIVTAVGASGESGASGFSTVTPQAQPPAPTGVSLQPGNGQMTVTWPSVAGATSYNIYYGTNSALTTTNSTKVTGVMSGNIITGLTNGSTYFVLVTAVGMGGESIASTSVFTTPIAPPSAPTGVTLLPGNAQITVSWTAVAGATSYNVYYSTNAGITPALATKVPGVTSGNALLGLTNGTTYYVVVTAVNAGGESIASTIASVAPITPPAAPTGVTLVPAPGQITVSWTAVTGAASYNIYYGTNSALTTTNGTKISGVTSTTGTIISGLTNGTPYYVIVTAVTGATLVEGAASATVGTAPGTVIGGLYNANTTFTTANSPYVMTSAVQIPAGVTLTIQPGVKIMYAGAYEIFVKGSIVANGSSVQPITFTSATNASSGATQIRFQQTNLATSQLSYVTMQLAATAIKVESIYSCSTGATGVDNTGTLAIANATIQAPIVTSPCSNASTAVNGLAITNSTISNTSVSCSNPWATSIQISNSTLSGATVTADSSCTKGIFISNSTVNTSTLTLGCCSAKLQLDENTSLSQSTVAGCCGSPVDGPFNLYHATVSDTSIDLSSARANILDSAISYSSAYTGATKLRFGNGFLSYSNLSGNNAGNGLEVTGFAGYTANSGMAISNSIISGHATGVLVSGGTGSTITSSNLQSNSTYNLSLTSANGITATNNYWGLNPVGSAALAKILDGSSNISYGTVTYSPYLTSASTTVGPRPLATNMVATTGGAAGQITLSWTAATGATSYNIYHATAAQQTASTSAIASFTTPAALAAAVAAVPSNATKYIPMTTTSGSTVSATLTALTTGTSYTFVVTAVNAVGEGLASRAVTVTAP